MTPPPAEAAEQAAARRALRASRRIVVKIGSALLARPRSAIYSRLAAQVSQLREAGREVLLVSSGSIALGLGVLGLAKRPTALASLQAAAAAGQPLLMRRWAAAFGRHGHTVAQVLMTHADLAHRARFLNARRALGELLRAGVVAVINENDSVATDEIRVGDNDQLSAQVSALVDADLLVILTSVDGLYDGDPERRAATRIGLVRDAREVEHMAGGVGRAGVGTGGMRTKVQAANAAASRGVPVVIAAGLQRAVLADIVEGRDRGTLFLPSTPMRSRKHWIAYTLKAKGRLHIDEGAVRAVVDAGKSLLPSGLVRIEGSFERGCMVDIVAPDGQVVARGLVAYSAAELGLLRGRRSAEIAGLLGYVDSDEVVHRDELCVLAPASRGGA